MCWRIFSASGSAPPLQTAAAGWGDRPHHRAGAGCAGAAKLAALCNAPDTGAAVQVKFADAGKPVHRLAVISGAGGSLFAEAIAEGADCLLTGEANHHHALDAKRLGLSSLRRGITPPSFR